MSVLPIYTYGAHVLRKKAKAVPRADNRVVELIVNMFETMRKASGIGLAATQVGELDRIIVIDVSDVEEYEDVKPIALINPEIVSKDGLVRMEEGCLSIPDVRGNVERPDEINVRFRDVNFDLHELTASGLLARVLQHEIDHLNGVLFIDYLNDEEKKQVAEQLASIEKGVMTVDYPVVTADAEHTRRVAGLKE